MKITTVLIKYAPRHHATTLSFLQYFLEGHVQLRLGVTPSLSKCHLYMPPNPPSPLTVAVVEQV